MELYLFLLIVLGLLMAVVIYQSRADPLNIQLYVQRLFKLVTIMFTFLKDVGVDAAVKFRQIDWDLTKTVSSTPPTTTVTTTSKVPTAPLTK